MSAGASSRSRRSTAMWSEAADDAAAVALVLSLLGAVVLLLRRRGSTGGRMNEQDRLAYVANLRSLLAERSADAAPPA